jgi:hypothetical protein
VKPTPIAPIGNSGGLAHFRDRPVRHIVLAPIEPGFSAIDAAAGASEVTTSRLWS